MAGSFLVHKLGAQAYWLYLPTAAGPAPLPLIVMLHGCGQTAVEFAQGTRMNQQAQQRCAVLYPEQSRSANSMRCWNWFEPEALSGAADTAQIVHQIRDAQERYALDPKRCHVAGFSAGAAMAAVLCSTHPALFARCAMHSGLMAQAASSLAEAVNFMRHGVTGDALERSVQRMLALLGTPPHTVPTLVIHGSQDMVVNPVNARQIGDQLQLIATRVHAAGVEPVFSTERWVEDSGRAYRLQQMTLDGVLLLRSILIDGLGHAWSGGDPRHEYFDVVGPDATALILECLLQQ
jgi:poly(hydroxyalkanoate) depolymerase family esterase